MFHRGSATGSSPTDPTTLIAAAELYFASVEWQAVSKLLQNRTGKALLAKHHTLKVSLRVAQTLTNHHTVTVASRTLTFNAPKHHKH